MAQFSEFLRVRGNGGKTLTDEDDTRSVKVKLMYCYYERPEEWAGESVAWWTWLQQVNMRFPKGWVSELWDGATRIAEGVADTEHNAWKQCESQARVRGYGWVNELAPEEQQAALDHLEGAGDEPPEVRSRPSASAYPDRYKRLSEATRGPDGIMDSDVVTVSQMRVYEGLLEDDELRSLFAGEDPADLAAWAKRSPEIPAPKADVIREYLTAARVVESHVWVKGLLAAYLALEAARVEAS